MSSRQRSALVWFALQCSMVSPTHAMQGKQLGSQTCPLTASGLKLQTVMHGGTNPSVLDTKPPPPQWLTVRRRPKGGVGGWEAVPGGAMGGGYGRIEGGGGLAMQQRTRSSHPPPCHRHVVITTNHLVHCLQIALPEKAQHPSVQRLGGCGCTAAGDAAEHLPLAGALDTQCSGSDTSQRRRLLGGLGEGDGGHRRSPRAVAEQSQGM